MLKRQIALTFDDGPSSQTMRFLDVLGKANAKASFFVVGKHVKNHERELKRMAEGGFQIGNHIWSHQCISEVSKEELRSSLAMTTEAIRRA